MSYLYITLQMTITLIKLPNNLIVVLLYNNRQGSTVSTVTRLWAGWSAGQFLAEARNSFFIKHVQTGSRATQPPTQWQWDFHSLRVKQLGHEVDHSPPPSAKVKNKWSHTSTHPKYPHGMDRDNFILLLCSNFNTVYSLMVYY